MFVTQKKFTQEMAELYVRLIRLVEIVMEGHDLLRALYEKHNCETEDIAEDLKQRINYCLERQIALVERIEAIEARLNTKKPTKKTKGK